MSQITENTLVVNKKDFLKIKEWSKSERCTDLRVIYENKNKVLAIMDCNGSPSEYGDWPVSKYLLETNFGDDEELWTRNGDGVEYNESISSMIENKILFPELSKDTLNKVITSIQYSI